MESTSLSPWIRLAWPWGVIVLVVVAFTALVVFTLLLRREPPLDHASELARAAKLAEIPKATPLPDVHIDSVGLTGSELVPDDTNACPTCLGEFDAALQYCPHDARELVPTLQMLLQAENEGNMCPTCRRAFAPEVRFCPHDASELIPVSACEAIWSQASDPQLTGVIAKICPQCRRRYDYGVTFCARDGTELVIFN